MADEIYKNVSVIVAVAENLAIGKNNTMPWHLRAYLQYFKKITMGKTIIMGRNTFASLGYKKLPGRTSVVITSDDNFADVYQVETHKSLPDALLEHHNEDEIMIIGGGKLYKEAVRYASTLYVTRVRTVISDADVFFPAYDDSFSLMQQENFPADEQNDFDYSFCVYQRKQ